MISGFVVYRCHGNIDFFKLTVIFIIIIPQQVFLKNERDSHSNLWIMYYFSLHFIDLLVSNMTAALSIFMISCRYLVKIVFFSFDLVNSSDVDECITGNHDCDVNSNCTNTVDSRNCTCKEGYIGNGRSCSGRWSNI